MRINPFFMPIIIIVALFATVFTAQAMGQWSTSGKDAIDMTKLTPADIKGWMTIQDVIDGLKVSPEWVYEAGKIPADVPATTAMKDLEKLVPGFETSLIRDELTKKLSGTSVPASQVPAQVIATPTPIATPKPTGIVGATATAKATTGEVLITPTPMPAGQAMPADQIKGKHTLKEVSELCAVPLDKILTGLKLDPKTDPNTAIKDLISAGKITEATDVQKVVAELQKK